MWVDSLLPSLLDCGVGITLSYSQEIPTNTPHLSLGLEMRIVQRADSRSVSPCPTTIPNEVKLSALLARKPTRCWKSTLAIPPQTSMTSYRGLKEFWNTGKILPATMRSLS